MGIRHPRQSHETLPASGTRQLDAVNDYSCRTLTSRPGNSRILGEPTLSLPGLHGVTALVPDSSAHHERFHLLYAGDVGITLSHDHGIVDVDLVRNNDAPALAGFYLVEGLHVTDIFSTEKYIVENGRQLILLVGVLNFKPGALLSIPSSPMLRVPLKAVLCDTPAPAPLPCDASAHHFTVPGPVIALPWTRNSYFCHHSAGMYSFTICATIQFRHATNPRFPRPGLPTTPPHLLRSNERRPALELSTNMESLAVTHAKSRLVCTALVGRRP